MTAACGSAAGTTQDCYRDRHASGLTDVWAAVPLAQSTVQPCLGVADQLRHTASARGSFAKQSIACIRTMRCRSLVCSSSIFLGYMNWYCPMSRGRWEPRERL
jgi:hypothetical protein